MKQIIKLKIEGMHCPSCVMNVDGVLEDLNGVVSSDTNYARSETVVEFNSDKIDVKTIASEIKNLGYRVSLVE